MKNNSVFLKSTAILVLLIFLPLAFQPSLASAQLVLLGEATSSGTAEVLTFADNWPTVGSSYPIYADSIFRTGADGSISFMFTDGTRVNLAQQSEIIISGLVGNYVLILKKGEMAYNASEGSSVQVRTEDYVVKSTGSAVGGVGFDGKYTTIVKISGQQEIATLAGERVVMNLEEGSIVLASGGRVVKDKLVGDGNSTGIILGILGFGSLGVALALDDEGGGVASSSSP